MRSKSRVKIFERIGKEKNGVIILYGVLLAPDMAVILVIHLYEVPNTAGVACEWGIALRDTPSVHPVPEQVMF